MRAISPLNYPPERLTSIDSRGVATAGFVRLEGPVAGPLLGTCARAPCGEACDWAIYNFVPHAEGKEVRQGLAAKGDSEDKFVIRTMARLHSLSLAGRDTAPLARFDDWRAHVGYLGDHRREDGS